MGNFPNINDFRNTLLDGGARPSLFTMEITFPSSNEIKTYPKAQQTLKFHCRIAEIPGNQLNPITIKYAGREVKYAGQRVFANMTVTIINDEEFTVRRGLEAWFEYINSREGNKTKLRSAFGSSGYGATGTITQYAKTGDMKRQYKLIDMFPVTLSPISLDWSNDGAIEEYTCDFAYQWWEPTDQTDRQLDSEAGINPIVG